MTRNRLLDIILALEKVMRVSKIMLLTLVLCSISILSLSCASETDATAVPENQVVTVQRGTLIIDVTAVGNLALSRTEDLAIDLFYQEGTVEEVLVEEGDIVEEGQVLARLDIEEWEEQLSVLEDAVTTAERQLTTAERQLTAKERDLLQAEINLEKAEIALHQANLFQWPDVETAQADLDRAKYSVEYAHQRLADAITDEEKEQWSMLVAKAEEGVIRAEERLNVLLSGTATDEVLIKRMELKLTEIRLGEAQKAIEDAQVAIEDAQKDVEDAQEELDEAKSKSPVITASFDGFITKVNVEGGDEVFTGTVAVQLADPNKFEAGVLVSEMDILRVRLGGLAWVGVDAMQGLSLPAKVTHISPTATIQQGVVNYNVKVEIQPLEAVQQERQQAREEAMQDIASGELPERLKQAVEAGSVTREQAEEMMKRGQQEQGGQSGQTPMMIPEDFQLREGLTVTVSIVVEERHDVLLVPNKAITRQGMETLVQVLKDGVIEERSIRIGISDWQFTEVTDGLSEGEKVVVSETTVTTPEASRQGSRPPFFMGGGGAH